MQTTILQSKPYRGCEDVFILIINKRSYIMLSICSPSTVAIRFCLKQTVTHDCEVIVASYAQHYTQQLQKQLTML